MIPSPSIKQLRFLRALSLRWQRRVIFIAGGLCVGLVAIGLAWASDYAQLLFRELLAVRAFRRRSRRAKSSRRPRAKNSSDFAPASAKS
jgi:hypothetical protein